MKTTLQNGVPDAAGFYWWRKSPDKDWRMVRIVNFAARYPNENPFLAAYDIECLAFSGRSLRMMKLYYPTGEWIECSKPSAEIL